MGVKDTGQQSHLSPSSINIKEDGGTVYHMDLYRIRDEQEAINAGWRIALFGTCRVEWPEKVPGIFPPDTLHIYIETVPGNTRNLRINL